MAYSGVLLDRAAEEEVAYLTWCAGVIWQATCPAGVFPHHLWAQEETALPLRLKWNLWGDEQCGHLHHPQCRYTLLYRKETHSFLSHVRGLDSLLFVACGPFSGCTARNWISKPFFMQNFSRYNLHQWNSTCRFKFLFIFLSMGPVFIVQMWPSVTYPSL